VPTPMKKEEAWNGMSHVAANPAAPDDDFKCCYHTREEWYTMGFHAVILIFQKCIPVHNKKILSCIDIDFGIIKAYLLSTYIYELELLIVKCVHKSNCCKDNRFRN